MRRKVTKNHYRIAMGIIGLSLILLVFAFVAAQYRDASHLPDFPISADRG